MEEEQDGDGGKGEGGRVCGIGKGEEGEKGAAWEEI